MVDPHSHSRLCDVRGGAHPPRPMGDTGHEGRGDGAHQSCQIQIGLGLGWGDLLPHDELVS